MKTTVNERITQIISQFGYKSKRSFAEKIGIAQTSLNEIHRGVSISILSVITTPDTYLCMLLYALKFDWR
jgi:hypothetical protein